MSKKITSRRGWLGTTEHFDSKGKKIGESRPGLFGTTEHFDAKAERLVTAKEVSLPTRFITTNAVTRWAPLIRDCSAPTTTILTAETKAQPMMAFSVARKLI